MIRVAELTKRYRSTLALDQLTLEVPAGSVFGILGPNGAGKTTLLRLLMGFVFPDSGRIDRGGLSPAHLGYLPERAFYPPRLPVHRYLTTIGRLAGLRGEPLRQTVPKLLSSVGMANVASRRLGACSRGMLQRVGLAQALLGNPPLLLLDEPALGLDPAGQKFMRDQILSLHAAGKSVILCSHHLDEVTRLCTHVAVLKQGKLMRSGPLAAILTHHPQVSIVTGPLPAGLAGQLRTQFPDANVTDEQTILSGDAVAHKHEILRLLLDAGVDIRHLEEKHSSLEDIYLEATGG